MKKSRFLANISLLVSRTWSIGAILNDLERPLTQISRSRHYLVLSVSETDIVTMEY